MSASAGGLAFGGLSGRAGVGGLLEGLQSVNSPCTHLQVLVRWAWTRKYTPHLADLCLPSCKPPPCRAPEPSDILWQHTACTGSAAFTRRLGSAVFTLLIVAAGAGVQYGLAVAAERERKNRCAGGGGQGLEGVCLQAVLLRGVC